MLIKAHDKNCNYPGCKDLATHVPLICVPKIGQPQDPKHSYECGLDIPLCERHKLAFPMEVIMTEALKDLFRQASRGKVMPDFNRAFKGCTPMKGQKYKKILVQREAKKGMKQ